MSSYKLKLAKIRSSRRPSIGAVNTLLLIVLINNALISNATRAEEMMHNVVRNAQNKCFTICTRRVHTLFV